MKLFSIKFLLLLCQNIICNYLCQGREKNEVIKIFIPLQASLSYQFDMFVVLDLKIMVHYSFGSEYCRG